MLSTLGRMLLVWAEGLWLDLWRWQPLGQGNRIAENYMKPVSGNGLHKFQTRRYRNACDQLVTIKRKDPGFHRGLLQFNFSMAPEAGLEPTTS